MAKPSWNKTLSEVLKQQTRTVTLKSQKPGNEYQTDVIPNLVVLSTGSVETVADKYIYSVVDTQNDLEYSIKVSNKVDVDFGDRLQFKNVRGGVTSSGFGWYAAESVTAVQRNA